MRERGLLEQPQKFGCNRISCITRRFHPTNGFKTKLKVSALNNENPFPVCVQAVTFIVSQQSQLPSCLLFLRGFYPKLQKRT